jgi:hypothetical protein
MASQDLGKLYSELKRAFESRTDQSKCGALLSQLKVRSNDRNTVEATV